MSGPVALGDHKAHQLAQAELRAFRVLSAYSELAIGNKISGVNGNTLIETQLPGIDLSQHEYRDRKLVNALHRKVALSFNKCRVLRFQ